MNKFKINRNQKDILTGLMLGDGCLETRNNGKTYRLKIEHSIKQKEYVDWLYKIFKNCVLTSPKIKKKTLNGREYQNYGFSTVSLGQLRFFGQQFYGPNGHKKIPKIIGKLLTNLSLAVWFMDDGSKKSNHHLTYIIHTSNFSKTDLRFLQMALKEKFKIETKLHKQRKYEILRWRLYICSESARKFEEIISPYILSLFNYKMINILPKK